MSRFTIAKAKYPYLKPYLFYKCFMENLRDKTALRQRYYFIRKYIKDYLKAARIFVNVDGLDKLNDLDGLVFISNAKTDLEKLIAYEVVSKPTNVILGQADFNKFIYSPIKKYLKAKVVDLETESFEDIEEDIINNKRYYLLFINDNFNDKLLESLLNSKAPIVPLKLTNTDALKDDDDTDELSVNASMLNLLSYEDYKNLNIEKTKELVINALKGEQNE